MYFARNCILYNILKLLFQYAETIAQYTCVTTETMNFRVQQDNILTEMLLCVNKVLPGKTDRCPKHQ